KTSVQNHLYVSKLHINDGLKEVVGFRNRFLSRVPTSFSRISQVSSQGGWSGADEINQGVVLVKTIEQELNVKEEIWGRNSLDMSENIVNIKSDTNPQFTLVSK
ncbi:hypothetical protein S245_039994, partial [Arachis hypogaea]